MIIKVNEFKIIQVNYQHIPEGPCEHDNCEQPVSQLACSQSVKSTEAVCNPEKSSTTGLKPPRGSPQGTEYASPSQSLAPPGEPFFTPRCNGIQIQPEPKPNGSPEAVTTPTPLAQPHAAVLDHNQAVTPSVVSAPTILLSPPPPVSLVDPPKPPHTLSQQLTPVSKSSPDAAPPAAAPPPEPSPATVYSLPSLQVPAEANQAAEPPRFHDGRLQSIGMHPTDTSQVPETTVRVVKVPDDDAEDPPDDITSKSESLAYMSFSTPGNAPPIPAPSPSPESCLSYHVRSFPTHCCHFTPCFAVYTCTPSFSFC